MTRTNSCSLHDVLLALPLCLVAACSPGEETTTEATTTQETGGVESASSAATVAVNAWEAAAALPVEEGRFEAIPPDLCGDVYPGVAWQAVGSSHFTFWFLPGSAAAEDILTIVDTREDAYERLVATLELDERPVIDVYLSPNRVAGAARGLYGGVAYPDEFRYEVIYTGDPDSYEVRQYGHELTHVLAAMMPHPRPNSMPILEEGLAEYFDQSGRDLHAAYALKLNAGKENRRYLAEFEATDVWAYNYGRAGSLVKALMDRYGLAAFRAIFREAHLSWSEGCYRHPLHEGCVDTPAALVEVMDDALRAVTGEGWAQFQPFWDSEVRQALQENVAQLVDDDRAEIENLVAIMDRAINDKDAGLYRSTMDGFYCDRTTEADRATISERVVQAYDDVHSRLLAVYPVGIKNFPAASALVSRTEGRGIEATLLISLERTDGRWRQTGGPDWQ